MTPNNILSSPHHIPTLRSRHEPHQTADQANQIAVFFDQGPVFVDKLIPLSFNEMTTTEQKVESETEIYTQYIAERKIGAPYSGRQPSATLPPLRSNRSRSEHNNVHGESDNSVEQVQSDRSVASSVRADEARYSQNNTQLVNHDSRRTFGSKAASAMGRPINAKAIKTSSFNQGSSEESLLTALAAKLNRANAAIHELQAKCTTYEATIEDQNMYIRNLLREIEYQTEFDSSKSDMTPPELDQTKGMDEVDIVLPLTHWRPCSLIIDYKHAFHLPTLLHNIKLLQPSLTKGGSRKQEMTIELFADGFISGKMQNRPYNVIANLAFMNDIYDGFFPWELRDRFPSGLSFVVKDHSWSSIFTYQAQTSATRVTKNGYIVNIQQEIDNALHIPRNTSIGLINLLIRVLPSGRELKVCFEPTCSFTEIAATLPKSGLRLWTYTHGYWSHLETFRNWTGFDQGCFVCHAVQT